MKLMTSVHCKKCQQLKDWLRQNDIHLDEVDAEQNEQLAKDLNVATIPALILDDDSVITSYVPIRQYFQSLK